MGLETISVRDYLKRETATLHQDTERAFNYMKPGFSVQDYKNIVQKFYGFYFPIEQKLSKSELPMSLNWQRRTKLHLLKEDLMNLEISIEQVPLCEVLPDCETPAGVMGLLYVLEGSTLGGQVLTKHFSKALGITPESGSAFFNAYGLETGYMWQKFIQCLEDEIKTAEERERALTSAKETFKALSLWMKN